MKQTHFGEHLTLDGYGGSSEKLNDRELVLLCLNDLPRKLGMYALAPPTVYSAPDNGLKDPGGWSGFVVVAESHISIHTFPKRRFVSIDAYTCKNGLDKELIEWYFREKFELEEAELNFIVRGKKYPRKDIA
jgi:S-adenosylmethionine decarboxylase